MIVVQPMPDETSSSHIGRLAWMNGCRGRDEIAALIRNNLSGRGHGTAGLPTLYQLALVSNMDTMDYARSHSMLAAFRVASKLDSDIPHGLVRAIKHARQFGLLMQRRGAYCCIRCITEDLHKWGFSWYRRKHHLVGVDWCHAHGDALHVIDDPCQEYYAPHIGLEEKKLVPVQACVANLPSTGFLNRYVMIALALLDRSRPFASEHIRCCLDQRARQHKLRIGKKGREPLLSDRIAELAPADWLSEHVEGFWHKVPSMSFPPIDGLMLPSRRPGQGSAYAMALAALYETADDALLDLAMLERTQEEIGQ